MPDQALKNSYIEIWGLWRNIGRFCSAEGVRKKNLCGVVSTHASRRVRSSQNFSQKLDLFLIRSTLVLSVRGSVLPLLLLPEMPVAMLCSDAEFLGMKLTPLVPPSLSDWDSDRCIMLLLVYNVYVISDANWQRINVVIVTRSSSQVSHPRIFW